MLTPLAHQAIAIALRGEFQRLTLHPERQAPIQVGVSIAQANGRAAVVFTELSENAGQSITNAAEFLANELHRSALAGIRVGDVEHFEHYGPPSYPGEAITEDSIERVSFHVGGGRYARPRWSPAVPLAKSA